MVSRIDHPSFDTTRVLLLHDRDDVAQAVTAAFETCSEQPAPGSRMGRVSVERVMCRADLPDDIASVADVVICGVSLPDATGAEVMESILVRGAEVPVVFTAHPDEAAVATELLYAGAADVVILNDDDPRGLLIAVERCLVHERIRAENERLHHDLTRSLVELELKNQELERVIEQLEQTARTDELTGLANRRWLNIALAGAWAEATRHDLPLAFVMIDLDGFKTLNDTVGHQRGDELLRLVGRVIQANCRSVDVCARFGGDEFCVLLPHTRPQEALKVGHRILGAFREVAAQLPEDHPPVSMSMGLSHVDLTRPANADQLLRHADEAMYAAKADHEGDRLVVAADEGPVVTTTPASSPTG